MYASLSPEALRWGMPPYNRETVDRWIGNIENLIALVALRDDRIIGHAQVLKFPRQRRKGTGDLIVYLHQDFHSVGLGTAMLSELIELARKERLHRIGLEVVADNEKAVNLYKKLGFKVEGVMRDAYFGEDEQYHDELIMGLLLRPKE